MYLLQSAQSFLIYIDKKTEMHVYVIDGTIKARNLSFRILAKLYLFMELKKKYPDIIMKRAM